jgi:hypothetical protein
MKMFRGILVASGAVALIGAGCEASVGGADAADGGTTGDATVGETAADTAAGDVAADTVAGKKYTHVHIDGSPTKEPDCQLTNSPGPDIDLVALYRGGKLQGVGRKGSAVFKPGKDLACKDQWETGLKDPLGKDKGKKGCPKNEHSAVEGKLDTEMHSDAKCDTGYFAVSNGTVVVQIGACSAATEDVKTCDGAGAVVEILPGDEIDVYEVDGSYKKGGKGPQSGIAPDTCVCAEEDYQVYVGPSGDKAETSLGTFKGTKAAIKVP